MNLNYFKNKMTTGGSGMELTTEILIIGGGASGMAAAVAAAEIQCCHERTRFRLCG